MTGNRRVTFRKKRAGALPSAALCSKTMNATQIADIRRRLLEERERIVAEWENHGGDAGPGDDWDLKDPEERATHISSAAVDHRIAEDDLNLLRKVEFALRRIEDDTYCDCANCGNPIPTERLMAKPSASLCIACQELKDATKP
jgi:DnaK suppressor protein